MLASASALRQQQLQQSITISVTNSAQKLEAETVAALLQSMAAVAPSGDGKGAIINISA